MFVGCIVVYDEMDIQFLWDGRIDVAQELEKLLVTMTLLALRQHATCGDVEGGEQRRGAVSNVVVSDTLYIAEWD